MRWKNYKKVIFVDLGMYVACAGYFQNGKDNLMW